MSGNYDDIIHLPHHVSTRHSPMPMEKRAAQFNPFAALVGYDEAVGETGRVTEEFTDLTEDRMLELNEKLMLLHGAMAERPRVTVSWFRPDEKKSGGAYVTASGVLRKISDLDRTITVDDRVIPVDRIMEIDSPVIRRNEEELR